MAHHATQQFAPISTLLVVKKVAPAGAPEFFLYIYACAGKVVLEPRPHISSAIRWIVPCWRLVD